MAAGFGAFGKMPSAGDFFRLNTPPGFVRVWDEWVQQTMLAGQAAYGPDFDRLYMSAPIWRFTLPAGLAGPEKAIGVLMPSIDRVGRRFPLTLAAPLATPGPAALDHFSETGLFEQLEEVALNALEDSMTQDSLAQSLNGIAAPQMRRVAPLRGGAGCVVMTGAPDLAAEAAASLLEQHLHGASLWTTVLDGMPRMLACPGLPQAPASLGLFDLAAPVWGEAQPL